MSWSPRLVEEGEPIANANELKERTKNNVSFTTADHRGSPLTNGTRSSFDGGGGGGSSLQQAAAILSMPKRRLTGGRGNIPPKTETLFVIGGNDKPTMAAEAPSWAEPTLRNSMMDGVDILDSSSAVPQSSTAFHNPQHWQPPCTSHTTTETFLTIGGPQDNQYYPALHQQTHHSSFPQKTTGHFTLPLSHSPPPLPNYREGDHSHNSYPLNYDQVSDDHDMDGSASHSMDDELLFAQTQQQPFHHAPYISPPHSHATALNPAAARSTTQQTQTSYEIGGESMLPVTDPTIDIRPVERMEGVQDLGTKMPLVVLDGANVAHHYSQAMAGLDQSSLSVAKTGKPEPDAQGIQVATDHFLQAGLRVLIVLPQYWFKAKPRSGDRSISSNALMETPQLEILNDLKIKGLIVASPPTDDDDAYALTIARREEMRSLSKRNGEGPGFVLSNDMFRDAQDRDSSGLLRQWLRNGRHDTVGPGRISYTFGDMGTMNDRGERILDFIPNPRHPLVVWMEGQILSQQYHG